LEAKITLTLRVGHCAIVSAPGVFSPCPNISREGNRTVSVCVKVDKSTCFHGCNSAYGDISYGVLQRICANDTRSNIHLQDYITLQNGRLAFQDSLVASWTRCAPIIATQRSVDHINPVAVAVITLHLIIAHVRRSVSTTPPCDCNHLENIWRAHGCWTQTVPSRAVDIPPWSSPASSLAWITRTDILDKWKPFTSSADNSYVQHPTRLKLKDRRPFRNS